MKTLFAAAIALAALSQSAAYACTADELQAKAMDFSTKLQALAQKDPQKASDWSQKFAAQQQANAAKPQSVDETCKMYDDLLASLPK